MSRVVTASATYAKGVLLMLDRTKFDVDLAKKMREGPCRVSVKQRGYLWAVVYPYLAEYFVDVDVDEVHDAMKLRFNLHEVHLENHDVFTFGGSTEDFDAGDYAKYTDRIRNWAALPIAEGGLALYIPAPNEG